MNIYVVFVPAEVVFEFVYFQLGALLAGIELLKNYLECLRSHLLMGVTFFHTLPKHFFVV